MGEYVSLSNTDSLLCCQCIEVLQKLQVERYLSPIPGTKTLTCYVNAVNDTTYETGKRFRKIGDALQRKNKTRCSQLIIQY